MKKTMGRCKAFCLAGLLTLTLFPAAPVQAAGHHHHNTTTTATCYKKNGTVCKKKNHANCTTDTCKKNHTHTSRCKTTRSSSHHS